MQEAISIWARRLCSYLIFSAAVQGVLPEKEDARYLRLFLNLLFLIVLFKPMVSLPPILEIQKQMEAILTPEVPDLEVSGSSALLSGYEEELSGYIRALLEKEDYQMDSIQIEWEEGEETFGIRRIVLAVSRGMAGYIEVPKILNREGGKKEEEDARLKTMLAGNLGIRADQICLTQNP